MVQNGCEQKAAIIRGKNAEKEHLNRLVNSRLLSRLKARARHPEGTGDRHSEDL